MDKINPKISQDFLKEIKNQSVQILEIDGLKIQTCSNVFPPQSQFSHSSRDLYRIFGNLNGCSVLDIGTGTGIQAMQTVKRGASKAVAIDINQEAVACAKENVLRNGLADQVTVLESDLFESVPKEKFDVIIANLPITDFPIYGVIESSLYDPDMSLHRRLFREASEYMNDNGRVILTHANLQEEKDFSKIEDMISGSNLKVDEFLEYDAIGYKWRFYRLVVK